MKTFKEAVLILIFTGVIFLLLFFIGIPRQEKVRCLELERQSKEFPLFYATEQEIEMCLEYGIDLR